MVVEFNIRPHDITPGVNVVDVLIDGVMAAVIFPDSSNRIKLMSAHIADAQMFEGDPVPAITVEFNPRPYEIIDGRIVRKGERVGR